MATNGVLANLEGLPHDNGETADQNEEYSFLRPCDVLSHFRGSGLTRALLYTWAKKGWIKTHRVHRGGTRLLYPEKELPAISRLVWAYSLGLRPDNAAEFASVISHVRHCGHSGLRQRFEALFRAEMICLHNFAVPSNALP